jgi:hypothetical protein
MVNPATKNVRNRPTAHPFLDLVTIGSG